MWRISGRLYKSPSILVLVKPPLKNVIEAAPKKERRGMQNSLFDLENRYASLSKTGDLPERLNAVIDWEIFRPILDH